MDTTTIICDTIAVKLNEVAGMGQAIVAEPGTNWQDVIIWVTLFLSFSCVFAYCAKQYFEGKEAQREAIKDDKSNQDIQEYKILENKLKAEIQSCKVEFQEQLKKDKVELEEKLKNSKVELDEQLQKRKVQLQDQMLKRKLELQDQLLSHLKEHSEEPTDENNGATTQTRKEYSDTYTSALEQAIKDTENLFNSVLVNDGEEA